MLRRQQASAVVAARFQIVDGAVGMVELALEKLSERNVVQLDEERKAAMVSNLLVVLCSDIGRAPRSSTPVPSTNRVRSMAERKSLLLRIRPELWAELNRWASEEFRSVNGQIEFLLQRAVDEHRQASHQVERGGHPPPRSGSSGR